MTADINWGFAKADENSPKVFTYNDGSMTKYLEDPHDPSKEAVAAMGPLEEGVSILVVPPCSVKTIQALASELPCLNHIIVVDTNEKRLNAWHDGVRECHFKSMSSMVLTKNLNSDKDVLMKILEPYPVASHLWKVVHYVPRRFRRLEPELESYIFALLRFSESKINLSVDYQTGEAWHHIVNQFSTLQDSSVKNFIIEPQTESRTFVVAGAGPSLEENIDVLKKYRDRVVILACERSIGTFKAHGVKPDFIVSVENIILMWRHYEEHIEFLKDIPLIAPYLGSHVVARNYPGDVIFMKITGNDEWLDGFGGEMDSDVGNCVGHYAYLLAASFNPENIILIGNDLALKDGRSHTGTTHSDGHGQKGIVTRGYYEGNVETTPTFFHYIQRFESYIRQASCPVINATEGGAYINGAEHCSLDIALSRQSKCSGLPYVEIPQVEVQEFYSDKVAQIRELRQRLVDSRADVEKIEKESIKPFFLFMEDALQVLLNHFLPPRLYLHYYDILQNYLPKRHEDFKKIVDKLIDESIDACDFLLALDKASRFDGQGKAGNILLLPPDGVDLSWIKEKFPQFNYSEMPALTHLPDIWNAIVDKEIGTIVTVNCRVIPDTWTIPNIKCVDIMTGRSTRRLFRTPGYQIVGMDKEQMDEWNWKHHLLSRFERMTVAQYFENNML